MLIASQSDFLMKVAEGVLYLKPELKHSDERVG